MKKVMLVLLVLVLCSVSAMGVGTHTITPYLEGDSGTGVGFNIGCPPPSWPFCSSTTMPIEVPPQVSICYDIVLGSAEDSLASVLFVFQEAMDCSYGAYDPLLFQPIINTGDPDVMIWSSVAGIISGPKETYLCANCKAPQGSLAISSFVNWQECESRLSQCPDGLCIEHGLPEFTTLGIVLAVVIVIAFVMYKNKKGVKK